MAASAELGDISNTSHGAEMHLALRSCQSLAKSLITRAIHHCIGGIHLFKATCRPQMLRYSSAADGPCRSKTSCHLRFVKLNVGDDMSIIDEDVNAKFDGARVRRGLVSC